MNKKWLLIYLLISLAFIFGCTTIPNNQNIDKNEFRLVFYVNETEEKLNGAVYLNEEFLGNTIDGELIISKEEIYPGTIYLNGTYNGTNFNFEFILKKDALMNNNIVRFYITKRDIDALTMDLSGINTDAIARRIFNGINIKREEVGIKKLKWEPKLAETAKKYAEELARMGVGYEHDVADRFIENDVFSLSNGYIYYYTGEISPEMDINSININNIPLTTSMKNIILNKYFDVAGSAVYCKKRECFLVVDFAQTEYSFSRELDEDFCAFSSIRWDNLPIDSVNTEIIVNSTGKIDVYILADKDDYSPCKPKKYLHGDDNVNFYQTTLDIKKGSGLFLYARNEDVNISVKLKYEV